MNAARIASPLVTGRRKRKSWATAPCAHRLPAATPSTHAPLPLCRMFTGRHHYTHACRWPLLPLPSAPTCPARRTPYLLPLPLPAPLPALHTARYHTVPRGVGGANNALSSKHIFARMLSRRRDSSISMATASKHRQRRRKTDGASMVRGRHQQKWRPANGWNGRSAVNRWHRAACLLRTPTRISHAHLVCLFLPCGYRLLPLCSARCVSRALFCLQSPAASLAILLPYALPSALLPAALLPSACRKTLRCLCFSCRAFCLSAAAARGRIDDVVGLGSDGWRC